MKDLPAEAAHGRHETLGDRPSLQGFSSSPESGVLIDSLWPGISRKLADRGILAQRRRFNGWVPALWVAAAAVLVFVFTIGSPTHEQAARRSPVSVTPIWDAAEMEPFAPPAPHEGSAFPLTAEELRRLNGFDRLTDVFDATAPRPIREAARP